MNKLPKLSLLEATTIAQQDLETSITKSYLYIDSISLKEPPPSRNFSHYSVGYGLLQTAIESFIPIARRMEISMNGITTNGIVPCLGLQQPQTLSRNPALSMSAALELAISEVNRRRLYDKEGYFPWQISFGGSTSTGEALVYGVRYTPWNPNTSMKYVKIDLNGKVSFEENLRSGGLFY